LLDQTAITGLMRIINIQKLDLKSKNVNGSRQMGQAW